MKSSGTLKVDEFIYVFISEVKDQISLPYWAILG